uniref:Cmyb_C domain-containing protein n=1 Tax=Gongylonema pulchrum TaxID=637853 RepID=A0A183ERK2_9BILA
LGPDDLRFNKTHFEKENSWEPSIRNSPPPIPQIHAEELAAPANFTDSQLLPSATSTDIPKRVVSVDTENTPPSVPQRSKDFLEESAELKKTPTNFSQGSSEPKMSTPNSFDSRRSLRDLTMNCISAIYPDPVGSHCGADFRAPNRTFDKLSAVGKEQPSLSSSAIARVLSVIVLIISCKILI